MKVVEGKLPIVDAPKDGTPVWLVFSDAMGEWRSLSPYLWRNGRWIAYTSRVPITSLLKIVGWLPAPDFEAGEVPVTSGVA